jgi:hypothetical protein
VGHLTSVVYSSQHSLLCIAGQGSKHCSPVVKFFRNWWNMYFFINYWNKDSNQAWARQVNEVALMRQTQMEQNNILFISRWDAFSKVLFKLCSLNESETVKYCYFLFWTNHKWYISFTHHSGMSHSNGQKFSFTHHSQSVSINHLTYVSFSWKHIVQTSLMLVHNISLSLTSNFSFSFSSLSHLSPLSLSFSPLTSPSPSHVTQPTNQSQ